MTVAEFFAAFNQAIGSMPVWPFALAAITLGLSLLPAAYWLMIGVGRGFSGHCRCRRHHHR